MNGKVGEIPAFSLTVRFNGQLSCDCPYAEDGNYCKHMAAVLYACESAGVRYEFQKKKTGFVVCFYRSLGEDDLKADKKPIKADKKPIKTDRQEKIVEYVKNHGTISNKEARELLGLSDSTTKRILKEMVEENILIIEGERKARKYLLSAKE